MTHPRDPHAAWKGIVMVIRPDVTKLPEGVEPMCRIVSKVDPDLGNRRAIGFEMPYEGFVGYFRAGDGDSVEVYAELSGGDGGHIEFYERASKGEFFTVQAQSSVPAH